MTKQTLHKLSIIEGISLLLLVLLAMPIKYLFAVPILVKFIGMFHGILFMILVAAILYYMLKNKPIKLLNILGAIMTAIIPFGWYLLDDYLD